MKRIDTWLDIQRFMLSAASVADAEHAAEVELLARSAAPRHYTIINNKLVV